MIGARLRRSAGLLTVVVGFTMSCGVVWHASSAAFSGYTTNPGNSWTTGVVALSDDDTATAMFNAPNLKPGDTGQRCLKVTYGGNVASTIKLYATAASFTGDLGAELNLKVYEGAAGTYADPTCSDWTDGVRMYDGDLDDFAAAYTDWSNGLAEPLWYPSTNGSTKTYKFEWTFKSTAGNSAQSDASTIGFTWEAQNSASGPANLALNRTATASASGAGEGPEKAVNGSVSDGLSDRWSTNNATKWLKVDLGSTKSIASFTVRHAGAGGESATLNTLDFDIDVSTDDIGWTNVVQARGSTANLTTHPVSTSGRYIRLTVINAVQAGGGDARIYEFEAYGS